MRRRRKEYYCLFIRETEHIIVSFTLQQIADYLQVDRGTVRRWMKNTYKHSCEDYIIWKGIEIDAIKRGFALKKGRY